MVRRLWIFTALLLAAGMVLASGEVVYFKNGKAMRIQKKTVQDGWIKVTLPGGSTLSFPEDVVERIANEDGVTAEPAKTSSVSASSTIDNKSNPGRNATTGKSSGEGKDGDSQAKSGNDGASVRKAPGGRPTPGQAGTVGPSKSSTGALGKAKGPKVKKKPLLKPGK